MKKACLYPAVLSGCSIATPTAQGIASIDREEFVMREGDRAQWRAY